MNPCFRLYLRQYLLFLETLTPIIYSSFILIFESLCRSPFSLESNWLANECNLAFDLGSRLTTLLTDVYIELLEQHLLFQISSTDSIFYLIRDPQFTFTFCMMLRIFLIYVLNAS